MNCLFFIVIPEKVEWCEEDVLFSFLALISSCNRTALEPGLVASFINVLSQSFTEKSCAPFPNTLSNLGCYRVPMNCSVSFSLFLITMAHQSHDQFRDCGKKRFPIEGWTQEHSSTSFPSQEKFLVKSTLDQKESQ